MSDPATPLGNATVKGSATIREIGPLGMISLRAATGTPGLAEAILAVSSTPVPGQRSILRQGDRWAAWMSSDEVLLVLPRLDVPAALATIAATFGTGHHLAVDVSDARSVFRIEGASSRKESGNRARTLRPALRAAAQAVEKLRKAALAGTSSAR